VPINFLYAELNLQAPGQEDFCGGKCKVMSLLDTSKESIVDWNELIKFCDIIPELVRF
jgi:hypothetical protein